jgi:hypothetical protein
MRSGTPRMRGRGGVALATLPSSCQGVPDVARPDLATAASFPGNAGKLTKSWTTYAPDACNKPTLTGNELVKDRIGTGHDQMRSGPA